MSLMIDVDGLELTAEDREVLSHPMVTGFILFARNVESVEQVAALIRSIRQLRPELLIAVDYEGGRVQRIRTGVTRIPAMRSLGQAERAEQLAEDAGLVVGAELAALDFDLPFAPVVDLDHGCSGVIGDRAFHRDPERVIALAGAYIRGLARSGLAATVKHFPGHGAVIPDSHVELPVDERPVADIESGDLRPFAALVRQGVPSVMTAHVVFTEVDDRPASFSPVWVRDWLRGRLGFTGCVVSDDLTMGGAAAMGGARRRVELAAAAGCDLLPLCNHRPSVIEALDAGGLDMPPGFESRLAALSRRRVEPDPTAVQAARERLMGVAD